MLDIMFAFVMFQLLKTAAEPHEPNNKSKNWLLEFFFLAMCSLRQPKRLLKNGA